MCLGTSSKDNNILFLLVKDVVINKGTYLNVTKYRILINAYNAIYIFYYNKKYENKRFCW